MDEVLSVNISAKKGEPKKPVPEIRLDSKGIVGDAHAGEWHRQVSLLSRESIDRFSGILGRPIAPGEFAENVTLKNTNALQVALLDRFLIQGAVLEVTQIGKECHGHACSIFREIGKCVMPKEGLFTRVVKGGEVRPGDPVAYAPKTLRIRIVTLSDRAAAGAYPDYSGPRLSELFQESTGRFRWPLEMQYVLLSDDAEGLRRELAAAKQAELDAVFTIGGTGVGPRDMAPETVSAFCDKLIPGIMESIRAKFGAGNPCALLSRSVAGLAGTTLVYTLPGSVRAAGEYLGEILTTLDHLILMVHGLDAHRRSGEASHGA
ncbi:MAG: MOSC domain-containing protein [Vicinamibacteria bacterium]|nr:MOSC domain-containing protein [Vicinamibacteria bacterium]